MPIGCNDSDCGEDDDLINGAVAYPSRTAMFIGGLDSLRSFLTKNLVYYSLTCKHPTYEWKVVYPIGCIQILPKSWNVSKRFLPQVVNILWQYKTKDMEQSQVVVKLMAFK